MNADTTADGEGPMAGESWGTFLFSFKGRMSRGGYWLFVVLDVIATFVVFVADLALALGLDKGTFGLITGILAAAAVWPELAVSVKRAHDRNRSGWFLLIMLIPFLGVLWLFIELGFLPGTSGRNRYGPNPVRSAR